MSEELGLRVENLSVVYHRRATAVQGVSLEVPAGGIVALVGTNGAGKTTTLRAIAGLLPGDPAEVTAGSVSYRGERIDRLAPFAIVKRGIALVPEREKVFETLTVRDNLVVPPAAHGHAATSEAFELFPPLAARADSLAGYLSGGERQMLAIARALLCRPRLLLVDEMTLGLAPKVVSDLLDRLGELSARLGVAVLLVEQNVAAALSLASYGYVMERGQIVFHGPAERLRTHEEVQRSYLGLGDAGLRSYREVKQYRRTRRWW
jgi:branched-chain amino acid transport system ATP-binding protein